MSNLYTGFDAFWWGTRLGPENGETYGFELQVGSTTHQVQFEDDTYTTTSGTPHPNVIDVIRDGIAQNFPGEFWMDPSDLRSVDGVWRRGWGIAITAGAPFTLRREPERGNQRALEILGFDAQGPNIASAPIGGGLEGIFSPRPIGLCWRAPRRAERRLSTYIHEQSVSGGTGQSLQLTRWSTDQIRSFRYPEIPAAHVRRGRADIDAYARVAGLPTGADTNVFDEFWLEAISTYSAIYAGYDIDPDTPFPHWGAVESREVLRSPVTSRYATDLDTCLSRSRRSAEHYHVEFALRVEDSTYHQG